MYIYISSFTKTQDVRLIKYIQYGVNGLVKCRLYEGFEASSRLSVGAKVTMLEEPLQELAALVSTGP